MEDIQNANQSVETPIETQPAAEVPVTTQAAPTELTGIKVKYNHEERLISHDEAPQWIQKGLNYDKLQERVGQYESQAKNLERVARYYGFDSTESYIQALDQAERDQQIQEEAARLGVDENVILEHLQPLREKVNGLEAQRQEYEQLKHSLEVQKQLVDLRTKYSDFDQYGQKVAELVGTKGYDLEDAYILASHQEKMSRLQRETEANTIRNLQQNAQSSPGALGAEGPEEKSGYLAMSPSERRAFRERVKRGEVS